MKPDGRKASEQRREMLLSVAEVKAWLDVSTKTVYRRIEDGTLAAVRVGRLFQDPCLVSDRPAGSMVQQRVAEQSEDSKVDNICRTNYIV